MNNYFYSVDVRNVSDTLGKPASQSEIHEYVIKELNFLKGQFNDDFLETANIIVVPVYGETTFDMLF